jgi:hypothetical protein
MGDQAATRGATLASITVEGFRGIGPRTTLELARSEQPQDHETS